MLHGAMIRSIFAHHLFIDQIFRRLDFECSDACFPKSNSLAQRTILLCDRSALKKLEQYRQEWGGRGEE